MTKLGTPAHGPAFVPAAVVTIAVAVPIGAHNEGVGDAINSTVADANGAVLIAIVVVAEIVVPV